MFEHDAIGLGATWPTVAPMGQSSSPSVFHLITGIDVGGAENHLLDLCSGLVDHGFDVTVGYLKGDGELASDFRDAGCTVRRIGIRTDVDPLGFLSLVRLLRSVNTDILHAHLFHSNVYGVLAAGIAGVDEVVVTKHNDEPFWQDQPIRTVHDLLLRRIDRVVTISDHVREYLLDVSAVDPETVTTVRYGLNPTPFDELDPAIVLKTRREFAADDDPLVGTVARLTEQKDLPTLLRAFARVLEAVPDARLVIVGRGEEEDVLRSLSTELCISNSVVFAGFRTDVPALMTAFDVFVLPSRWEGFGVVFMEAMAAGTPVVASDVSAIPEVVVDGETGFLCRPGDEEAFAEATVEVLADDGTSNRLGQAGRARLEKEFTVDRMVDETIAVYRDLLSN